MPMFMVLSSWHDGRTIARVHLVHLMNVERRQAAADPQTTWAVSPPVGCQSLHPPSPFFIIITQPKSLYSFYRPAEGRRLSRPPS